MNTWQKQLFKNVFFVKSQIAINCIWKMQKKGQTTPFFLIKFPPNNKAANKAVFSTWFLQRKSRIIPPHSPYTFAIRTFSIKWHYLQREGIERIGFFSKILVFSEPNLMMFPHVSNVRTLAITDSTRFLTVKVRLFVYHYWYNQHCHFSTFKLYRQRQSSKL